MITAKNSGTDLTGERAVVFTLDGLRAGNYVAEVLHESRSIPLKPAADGAYTLTVELDNYEVHLYKTRSAAIR